jgi:hypothetical protein
VEYSETTATNEALSSNSDLSQPLTANFNQQNHQTISHEPFNNIFISTFGLLRSNSFSFITKSVNILDGINVEEDDGTQDSPFF